MSSSLVRSAQLEASWLIGLVRRRLGRVAAAALGVSLAVALLASLGTFLSASQATMTRRAIAPDHVLATELPEAGDAIAIGGARGDAVDAQVLFLFLGAPGAVLAGLLTAAVGASAGDRRRRDQALLRTRGATTRQLVGLGIAEAVAVGATGALVGLGIAQIVGHLAFGTGRFGATPSAAIVWSAAAVLVGFAIAAASIAVPARRDAMRMTVVAARQPVGRARDPRWMRVGLDFILLGTAGVVFWFSSRNRYRLVLAAEGVPTISVSYWVFAGPALLWVGAGLLGYRLIDLVLSRGRSIVAVGLRPLVGSLSDTIAASLQRQRRLIARGAALVALTVGFAVSTAVVNATYRQQAQIDAVPSNGADVTLTTSPRTLVPPTSATATAIAATSAVDLAGLAKVELGFALALAAAATGLTLWLGLAERRRTFVIAAALGANRRQLGGFVWAEAGVVTIGGIVTGAMTAWALSNMLVKVLTGVFDPAPTTLAVPWPYLTAVLTVSIAAAAAAAVSSLRGTRSPSLELLRTI